MASMEDFALEELEQAEKGQLKGAFLRHPLSELGLTRPLSVPPDATVADAVRSMVDNHTGCVCVAEAGRLVGIFTERDVVYKIAGKGLDPAKVRVREAMTSDPEVLRPEDGMVYCLSKMTVGGFRHVPLVDEGGRPMGIVAMRDIVRYIVSLFPEAVLNNPPDPSLELHKTADGA